VALSLTVESSFTDIEGTYSNKKYTTYYICRGVDDADVRILVRDCLVNLHQNLLPGDTVTVYGEGAGNVSVTDIFYETHTAPCLHMAYVDVTDTAEEP